MKSFFTADLNNGVTTEHHCFSPKNLSDIQEVIIITAAIAINPKYYKAFAKHIRNDKKLVIIVNFRGTGLNASHLKNKSITFTDWATEDLNCLIAGIKKNYPDANIHCIGHSMGGFVFGMCPNLSLVSKITLINVPTGALREFKFHLKVKISFYAYILVPFFSAFFKCANFKIIGLGENMPLGVVKQFINWVKNDDFFNGAVEQHENMHHLFRGKLISVCVLDDSMADLKRIKKYGDYFAHASSIKILTINPSDYQLKSIGHIGFFKHRRLWNAIEMD